MKTAKVFWLNMIDRQIPICASAVLAGEIIAPEYFSAGQFYFCSGLVNHALQADDRWAGEGRANSVYLTAAVLYQ
jgi:hypothetical protein